MSLQGASVLVTGGTRGIGRAIALRLVADGASRAVLGYMRLPCPGQIDDGVGRLAGRVRVEIAATAGERKAWSPWLPGLIAAMVPLTARLQLVWISGHALRTDRLDGTMKLEADPIAHLGTDAITGVARLPETGSRLSSTGPAITTTAR